WQYVHHVFEKAGADKVIWVWNPWDPASVNQFFPGNNYVDWLGVNIGGSDAVSFRNNTLGFDSAYRPYHRLPLFTSSGLPVMITETAGYVANSVTWWNAAWKTIDTGFTEIKSVIGGAGDNVFTKPVNTVATNTHPSVKMLQIKDTDLPKYSAGSKQYSIPHGIKNIIYNKGHRWFRNRHTLNLKTIEEDVAGMKAIGINTIERIMPGFYDDKLEKILLANKMNLVPRFWLLAAPEVIADDRQMEEQKEKILKVIKNNLSRENIIAWNLGDDVLYVLGNQTYKPGYFYYQQKYIAWLAGVCTAIRQLDSSRPIIMDLHWDAGGLKRFQYYKIYVPWINSFMLEADAKYRPGLAQPLEAGMAWGKVPVELWQLLPSIRQSGTVPAWQDIENTSFISMDGILDIDGRKKEQYATVMNTWGNKPAPPSAIPEIKILRPLAVTKENTRLYYQVIYKKDNARWLPFSQDMAGIRFEWYLVRIDQYGNTMFIKKAGEGTSVKLFMPKDPNYYQLYVEAITGGEVKMVHASLNTPLE
ncbi:MAG TPA: hypothetical protein VK645_14010, partial [Chitinophagaceae bacterium]|nr:hypothetical protein [Chitinophagaceae bacterium]